MPPDNTPDTPQRPPARLPPTLVPAGIALRVVGDPGLALGRLYVGQFVKVLLTVAMFYAVARQAWVVWPALIGSYIATLVVFWLVPALGSRRLPPRSRTN